MSSAFDLERRLTALLEDEAPPHAPDDLLRSVTEHVSRTRHRPAWATLERWIPMETRAQFGAVPRAAVILVILVVLSVLAAAIVAGQQPTLKLPAPYGPADNGLIAFDANGDVWVANADGSQPRTLLETPEQELSPVFSRDGTHIASWQRAATEEAEQYEIAPSSLVVMAADATGRRTLLADVETVALNPPVWSPDGRLLLVTTEGDDGTGIAIVDVVTGEVTELATGFAPTWAPDGERVAFVADVPEPGIYVVEVAGGDPLKVSHVVAGGFGAPDWSPDGSRIVFFTPYGPGDADIWVVDADGSDEVALSDDPADEYWATWSPDGRHIAYDRWDDELMGNHLVIAAADGSGEIVLGGPVVDGSPPVWSPDGTRVYAWQYAEPWGDYAIGVYDVTNEQPPFTILTPASRGYGSWQRLAP